MNYEGYNIFFIGLDLSKKNLTLKDNKDVINTVTTEIKYRNFQSLLSSGQN